MLNQQKNGLQNRRAANGNGRSKSPTFLHLNMLPLRPSLSPPSVGCYSPTRSSSIHSRGRNNHLRLLCSPRVEEVPQTLLSGGIPRQKKMLLMMMMMISRSHPPPLISSPFIESKGAPLAPCYLLNRISTPPETGPRTQMRCWGGSRRRVVATNLLRLTSNRRVGSSVY